MADHEFDRYARRYSEEINKTLSFAGKDQDFYTRCKVPVLVEVLNSIAADRPSKVLDVGCGIGLIHPYLAPSIGELHAVDVSEPSIEVARRNNSAVHYRTYPGDRLPYDDASFDCAYAICVMHHLPAAQWAQFLEEMVRVVRPGGAIALIEHNPLNPGTQWVVRNCEIDDAAVLILPWNLRRMMRSAGTENLSMRYLLFTPFDHAVFRWLDRALARLPFGAQYAVVGRVPSAPPSRNAVS